MARIKVLGGTGYAGEAVVREAARRGHTVTSFSRTAPAEPVAGVEYVHGSLLDPQVLASTVEDADVVFEALSPRGDMAGRVEEVFEQLVKLADQADVRVGILGGASSLRATEGGPRLLDLAEPPAEVLPEILTGIAKLDALETAPESLDWFYVSPAQDFGAWLPQRVTGGYRTGGDVVLRNEDGESYIAAPDLALAVLDEIEQPRHARERFHVAL